jgi:hypothetical protein
MRTVNAALITDPDAPIAPLGPDLLAWRLGLSLVRSLTSAITARASCER